MTILPKEILQSQNEEYKTQLDTIMDAVCGSWIARFHGHRGFLASPYSMGNPTKLGDFLAEKIPLMIDPETGTPKTSVFLNIDDTPWKLCTARIELLTIETEKYVKLEIQDMFLFGDKKYRTERYKILNQKAF